MIGLASYQEEDRSIDMFTQKIGSVDLVVNDGEARVDFGRMIRVPRNRNRRFAVFLRKQANGCILKPRYFDGTSEPYINRRRLTAGDDTAILLYEYSAFPMFTSAEAVGRSSIRHFGFCTA